MEKRILYFILLSIFVLAFGYDIETGARQWIGGAYIKDSTTSLMTFNHSALINGDIRSKTDIYIPVSEQLNIGENYIKGDANNLTYFSTIHTFFSQAGTSIATFDSATGITFAKDFIPEKTKNNSAVASLQFEKIKTVRVQASGSNSTVTTATHGITDWHNIVSWTAMLKDEANNIAFVPGHYYGAANLFYAKVDSLTCQVETGSAASNILSDTVFFRIVYTDFQR